MRKTKRALLALAVALLLCLGAFAAEPDTAGLYGAADVAQGVTITPDGTETDGFYAGAESVTVTVSDAVSGALYLLVVTDRETTAPQDADIVYLDQLKATGTEASFTVYLPTPGNGTYYVYLSTNAGEGLGAAGLEKLGSFRSFAPYLPGDVDENGSISVNDALYVLESVAGKRTLDGYAALAADADGSGDISADDALCILQAVAHLRTLS